jgi:hypothetical protein
VQTRVPHLLLISASVENAETAEKIGDEIGSGDQALLKRRVNPVVRKKYVRRSAAAFSKGKS